MMVTSRTIRQLWLLLLFGGALGLVFCVNGCGKKVPTSPVIVVPKADFQSKMAQINKGMSYEEVVQLLGGTQGRDVTLPVPADAPAEAKTVKMYQWADNSGKNLVCTFQSNKLVEKRTDDAMPAQPPDPSK